MAAGKALGVIGVAYELLRPEVANAPGNEYTQQLNLDIQAGYVIIAGGVNRQPQTGSNINSAGRRSIDMQPDELIPIEEPKRGRIQQLKNSMSREGYYSSKPVRFYEKDGIKYIVDGHHRTQAAKELGIAVKGLQVDESYLLKRWGVTAADFMKKAFNFLGRIK